MISFDTLGHVNIVVDDLEEATAFYRQAFGAVPRQTFPHFRNVGFAKAAGVLEQPDELDVSIRFLELPTREGLMLELMQYHSPGQAGATFSTRPQEAGGLGHIALRVNNIDEAFEALKGLKGVRMVHSSPEYRPFRIDPIGPSEFRFHDDALEADPQAKQSVCAMVASIKYFYFVDPYGIRWELEQGHSDTGSKVVAPPAAGPAPDSPTGEGGLSATTGSSLA